MLNDPIITTSNINHIEEWHISLLESVIKQWCLYHEGNNEKGGDVPDVAAHNIGR